MLKRWLFNTLTVTVLIILLIATVIAGRYRDENRRLYEESPCSWFWNYPADQLPARCIVYWKTAS